MSPPCHTRGERNCSHGALSPWAKIWRNCGVKHTHSTTISLATATGGRSAPSAMATTHAPLSPPCHAARSEIAPYLMRATVATLPHAQCCVRRERRRPRRQLVAQLESTVLAWQGGDSAASHGSARLPPRVARCAKEVRALSEHCAKYPCFAKYSRLFRATHNAKRKLRAPRARQPTTPQKDACIPRARCAIIRNVIRFRIISFGILRFRIILIWTICHDCRILKNKIQSR